MFKYGLEKGSKKFKCPSCGQKTFTRYIDNDTGRYVGTRIGRCDREHKCSFHNPPGFHRGCGLPPIEEEKYDREVIFKTNGEDHRYNQLVLKRLFVWSQEDYEYNNFVCGLGKLFNSQNIKDLIERFKLGTHRKSRVLFWQIDEKGIIRTGKSMFYDKDTLKRDSHIRWAHTSKSIKNFSLQQCLFGLHQIADDNPEKPIGIVESEKTAVIMSGYYPGMTWMASGGIHNLTAERLVPIKERFKILFPDIGAELKWAKKAFQVPRTIIANWSAALSIKPEEHPGEDLADFLHPVDRMEDLANANNCSVLFTANRL